MVALKRRRGGESSLRAVIVCWGSGWERLEVAGSEWRSLGANGGRFVR
jgi:hypothetical protein